MSFAGTCKHSFQLQQDSGYFYQVRGIPAQRTCSVRVSARRKDDGLALPGLRFRLIVSLLAPRTNLVAAPQLSVTTALTGLNGLAHLRFKPSRSACWYFLRGPDYSGLLTEAVVATRFQLNHPFACDCAGTGCA
jgi:hypothetical protein